MNPDRSSPPLWKTALVWGGGALFILALVVGWLWWTAPEQDLLPSQYRYGVL